ncbi:tRNA (guanine(46)-N(7))-methyltransferase TrmB [Larsenimonas rhizosphaerae]|uniref:tRNA (guanine(46)-N(7))-methyltransferase n=1 Tax=Larsenimonas rhizosphaerae TaxID=2944682 RepID=A0AA41ZI07_9GAMM|nr:SAM-dependent methyltransferase [Larsenimonas rhizosphaerae]MCX2524950.1 SAM-dependent methyltransferase [Larsenimonas rhizosphaerae]
MQGNSSSISTSQHTVHEHLATRVQRALSAPWQRPIADHSREAFERAQRWREYHGGPLILDSGCGVGISTRRLSALYPDNCVIGIDRSADRLSRQHGALADNAFLIRADLVDFWRLALAAGWQPSRHYILYPNPYPKPGHLKLRWHGHPVFPALLALGGEVEVRSNWRIYVEEFAQAMTMAGAVTALPAVECWAPNGDFMTPFERKYHDSGQSLWRMRATLSWQPSLMPTDGVINKV